MSARAMLAVALLASAACKNEPDATEPLTVAAAANLSNAFSTLGAEFERKTGIRVVFSYGSTAQLAQQIENGAPFDVFAAADTLHVDRLIRNGTLAASTRQVYATGSLAVWSPRQFQIGGIESLKDPSIRYIAIANPATAPYGSAAVEAMRAAGIWSRVEPKVVYAANIVMAKQYAATGNADVAVAALSLVINASGSYKVVDSRLHKPLLQAMAMVSSSRRPAEAQQFIRFTAGPDGRAVLSRYGYKFGR